MLNTSKQQFFELDTFNNKTEQTTKAWAVVSFSTRFLFLNHTFPQKQTYENRLKTTLNDSACLHHICKNLYIEARGTTFEWFIASACPTSTTLNTTPIVLSSLQYTHFADCAADQCHTPLVQQCAAVALSNCQEWNSHQASPCFARENRISCIMHTRGRTGWTTYRGGFWQKITKPN